MDFMIETALLAAWGTVWCLVLLFCVDAIATGVCKAYRQVTGRYLYDDICNVVVAAPSSIGWFFYGAYTWGFANPVWLWNLCNTVEEMFKKGDTKSPRYFG